jgi:hypothetical protein
MAPDQDLFIIEVVSHLQITGSNKSTNMKIDEVHNGFCPVREMGETTAMPAT